MYRVLLLVSFAAVVFGEESEAFKKCHIMRAVKHCCTDEHKPPSQDFMDTMKECSQLRQKPPSCEMDICIGSKNGYVTSDGKVDKENAAKSLETYYGDKPQMLADIKAICINGDLSKYGMPDMCDATKLRHCIEIQHLKSCSGWSEDGTCAGVQDKVAECLKVFE